MLIKYDVGWGQNESCEPIFCQEITLNNKNLSYTGPRGKVGTINSVGIESFFLQRVSSWQSGSLTPHTIDYDVSDSDPCRWTLDDPILQGRVERNCIASNSSVKESVFQLLPNNHRFDPSVDYCIEVDMQLLRCGISNSFETDIELRSAKGLINSNGAFPTNAVSELIERRTVNSLDARKFVFSFTPQAETNQNLWKDQIWVIADANSSNTAVVSINDITIKCRTNALASLNIIDLENNTYRFNGIGSKIFETYSWTINEVPVLNNDENLLIQNFNEVGEYQVCLWVTDEYGCCGVECTEIIICEEPDSPEITIRENFCSSYTFSIENLDPTMSYTWSILGGSPSTGTGTMFSTMLNVPNGFYTISVTGQNNCGTVQANESFAFQCSTEPSSCINQRNCISIGENDNSVTLLSTLIFGDHPVIPSTQVFFGYEVKNLCFSVKGKLIVDVGLIYFTNTNWFMGPGSSIEITPNGFWGSRYFINSHLQGCDQMWRGIILNADTPGGFFGTGGLSLTRTTIEDAFRGVELQNNTSFISYNSNYFDNTFGVFVGGNELKNIHTNIQGSVFENKGNLLPPYTGQPSWSNINRFGIHASGMSRMNVISTSNNKNKFKNLQTGIWVNNVELKASHNEFEDNQNISSVGIRIGRVPAHVEIVNGNVFHNLLQSIYLVDNPNRSVVHILNNTFTNTRNANQGLIGVYVQRSPFTALTIGVYNSFDYINGRCVYVQGGLSGLTLNDNTVKISGTILQPFRIDNVQNTSKIERNDFKVQGSVGYLGTCISLLNCRKLSVIDNEMSGTTNSVGASCLTMHGSNKCLIRGNRVLFNHGSAAFIIWGSETTENGFCCNTATSPAKPNFRSFYFSGENGMSFIRQNDIYSLYLDGNFGPQRNAGNNWLGSESFATLADGTSQKASSNRFQVDAMEPTSMPLPSNIFPEEFATDWFKFDGTHPTCSISPTCDIPLFFNDIDDPDLTYDGPDAQDTIIVIVDPARPSCEALIDLYDRLESIDSVANPIAYWSVISLINKWKIWKGSAWIESCLDSVVTFNIDITPWYDVEKEKDKIYHVDEDIRQEMAPIMQVVYDLNDQLDTVTVDSTMVLPPHVVIWYDSLKNALDSLQVLNEQIQQDILDKASSLIAQVNALPTPLPFLVDRKKVWQVEMKYLSGGLGSITSGEWAQIRIIADKCPLTDGQAVYEAMSLLHLIDEETEINANCSPSTPRSKKTSNLKQISVFPNPGKGFFTFELPTDILSDQCAIYEMSGRKVWDAVLIRGNHTLQVDLQHLKAGLYIYVFKNGETLVHQGKLVIIE